MTIRPLAMLAAALLALPWATSAVAVQWRIDGTLTDVEPYPAGSIPSGIAVGNPFSVLLGFDTAAPLTT